MTNDVFRRIEALIQVGLRIARSAPSGRIALARVAGAIDPAWIPHEGEDLLAELQSAQRDALTQLAHRDVERTLQAAWGVKPAEELDDLDPAPAAITPIAQVHRGALDGSAVAVKVLRPGVAAAVRQDLALLEGLLAPLQAAFPALDPAATLREVRERVLDELDLEHEAATQRRFHRALRRHPFLFVPAPVMRLCSDDVLVSEWVDGVPLSDAPDRDEAAARLMVFGLGAARSGVIHGDLHPDDVLVLDDGRLAILDFGSVRDVDRSRIDYAAAALEAFADDDAEAFAAAIDGLGWLPRELGDTLLALGREALAPFLAGAPARLDSDAVIALGERLIDRAGALSEVLMAGALPPEDLWPARGAGALLGTIARVGARGDWLELARRSLRDGWDAAA